MVNTATPHISLKNAVLGYRNTSGLAVVLNNINLDFYAGDLIGVVGLNGTGKSTLLKSICGLAPLLGGIAEIDGVDVRRMELGDMARKIAIVLTEKIGGFNLTVFDAVAAGQIPYTDAFHRLGTSHLDVINKAIAVCGIEPHRHKLLQELSDGLFQKTMIARSLAQQTPTLLLDEPSAFLDYASKHELFLQLKALALDEKKCVLVSSHDLDLVLKYCARLLVIGEEKAELIDVARAASHQDFLKIGRGFI